MFPGMTCEGAREALAVARGKLGIDGRLVDPRKWLLVAIDESTAEVIRDAAVECGHIAETIAVAGGIESWLARVKAEDLISPPLQRTIGVYVDGRPRPVAFAQLCEVLRSCGCRPSGILRLRPSRGDRDGWPEAGRIVVDHQMPPDRFISLTEGRDEDWRVAEAAFYGPAWELLVARYGVGEGADGGVLEVVTHDAVPGTSRRFWTDSQEAEARKYLAWLHGLTRDACDYMEPLYGSIDVEEPLLPPALLSAKVRGLAAFFVSSQLLGASATARDELCLCYGRAPEEWRHGTFYSNPADCLDDEPDQAREILGRLLSASGYKALAGRGLRAGIPLQVDRRDGPGWGVELPGLARVQATRFHALVKLELGIEGRLVDPHIFYTLRASLDSAQAIRAALMRRGDDHIAISMSGELGEWLEKPNDGNY